MAPGTAASASASAGSTAGLPDLNQLFEISRQLTSHIVAPGTMPQLERGLDQIDLQTRKLSAKSSRGGDLFTSTSSPAPFPRTQFSSQGLGTPNMAGPGLGAQRAASPVGGHFSTPGGPLAGSSAVGAPGQIDARTAYLLANRGFDADKVTATLALINSSAPVAVPDASDGLFDTDVDGHLKVEHENIVVSAIEESRRQTLKDCNERFERTLHRDWEKTKKRIFEELGQHQQISGSKSFQPSPFKQSRIASSTATAGGLMSTQSNDLGKISMQMMAKSKSYAQVVELFNHRRLESKSFDLLGALYDVSMRLDRGDLIQTQVMKSWRLLQYMFVDPSFVTSGSVVKVPLLAHAHEYRALEQDGGSSDDAVKFRKRVLAGSRRFFEENYLEYIQQIVSQNRVHVGGVPSLDTIIDAFIDLRFKKHGNWIRQLGLELYNNKAYWAHLYYLLRCGSRTEALQYAQSLSTELKGSDSRFVVYFREYIQNGRLSPAIRSEILDDWNSRIRQTHSSDSANTPKGDPFKAAVYKIVGRCEMSIKSIKSNEVAPSVEDYLWLQLCLIQEDVRPEDSLQDRYTLRDMSRNMLRFGPAHFTQNGRHPHIYFIVLMLCGEFERAVAHLATIGSGGGERPFIVEAVHLAIALASMGVLRIPESPQFADVGMDLLITRTLDGPAAPGGGLGTFEIAYLHFAGLVHSYIRPFYQTDPLIAIHYISTIGIFGAELGMNDANIGDDDISMGEVGGSRAQNERHFGAGGLLPLRASREYTKVTHAHLRELLLESGMSPKLVGEAPVAEADDRDTGGLGVRTPGAMEKLASLVHINGGRIEFVRRIIRPAAEDADRRGKLVDAVQLFDLAMEYDEVVGILSRQLSEAITSRRAPDASATLGLAIGLPAVSSSERSTTEAPQALEVFDHYERRPAVLKRVSIPRWQTAHLLAKLYRFTIEYDAGRFETALDLLRSTGLLPLDAAVASTLSAEVAVPTALATVATRWAESSSRWDALVARCLPQIFLLAMATLRGLYGQLKAGAAASMTSGVPGVAAKQKQFEELRVLARVVVLCAGSIQYRIPSDVLSRLNRLEVEMST